MNASSPVRFVVAHDLPFVTSFIIATLFLMVKASPPVTYQFLTVHMIESIGQNEISINIFKTNEKYGFVNIFKRCTYFDKELY